MRCVPSAAQNSRMRSRPHFSHPSLAATSEVSCLRRNVLVARHRSNNCSKKLRASRAAIVVPETVVVVQFTEPAANAAQSGQGQKVVGASRKAFLANLSAVESQSVGRRHRQDTGFAQHRQWRLKSHH